METAVRAIFARRVLVYVAGFRSRVVPPRFNDRRRKTVVKKRDGAHVSRVRLFSLYYVKATSTRPRVRSRARSARRTARPRRGEERPVGFMRSVENFRRRRTFGEMLVRARALYLAPVTTSRDVRRAFRIVALATRVGRNPATTPALHAIIATQCFSKIPPEWVARKVQVVKPVNICARVRA